MHPKDFARLVLRYVELCEKSALALYTPLAASFISESELVKREALNMQEDKWTRTRPKKAKATNGTARRA